MLRKSLHVCILYSLWPLYFPESVSLYYYCQKCSRYFPVALYIFSLASSGHVVGHWCWCEQDLLTYQCLCCPFSSCESGDTYFMTGPFTWGSNGLTPVCSSAADRWEILASNVCVTVDHCIVYHSKEIMLIMNVFWFTAEPWEDTVDGQDPGLQLDSWLLFFTQHCHCKRKQSAVLDYSVYCNFK